jgi:chemotaxis protein histidine kinase CheA
MGEDDKGMQYLCGLYRKNLAKQGVELTELAARDSLGEPEVTHIRFLSHTIAGSAILFGHEHLGEAARLLEDSVLKAAIEKRPLTIKERPHFDSAFSAFMEFFDQAVSQ